jgi:methyl-accepting chemotaxis protein
MSLIPWTRARRAFLLRDLETRVGDHLPALPVLSAQLTQTAAFVERAVTGVCAGFTDMAQRARATVAQASGLLKGDSESAGQGARIATVIEHSQQTLESLLERIVKSSELSMRAVYRINDAEQTMRDVVKVLGQIDRIALGTKIVALNAKIEASRAGEWGQGFEVVADEISRQADESAAIAGSVRETVVSLRSNLADAVRSLKDLASRDLNDVAENKALIERAMAELRDSHAELQQAVEKAAVESERLAGDISAAVTALQFQDRVSQRIGHVVDALQDLGRDLGKTMGQLEPGRDWTAPTPEVLARLGDRYSLHEEHRAHHVRDNEDAADAAGGSVELF